MKRSFSMNRSLTTKLTAYLPVFTTFESKERRQLFWDLIDELCDLSDKFDFSYLGGGQWSNVVLSLLDGEENAARINQHDKRFYKLWARSNKARARYILKVSVTVSFS